MGGATDEEILLLFPSTTFDAGFFLNDERKRSEIETPSF